jgi:leucyl aminopeptidase
MLERATHRGPAAPPLAGPGGTGRAAEDPPGVIYRGRSVEVELTDTPPEGTDAGLLCVGLFEGEEPPGFLAGAPGVEDVESKPRSLGVVRPEGGPRVLVVGLGERDELDAERIRVAAALGVRQAARFEATHVAWSAPDGEVRTAAALTSGTILASYSFDAYKSHPEEEDAPATELSRLTIHGAGDAAAAVEIARVGSEAANRARDLQNTPANVADPAYLADRAREIAATHESVEAEVLDRGRIESEGMGGILAVSAGSAKEPALIVLRHRGGRDDGPTLGLVGKGVTFDSGGISIKPAAGMELMKKDMSGGAAVIEAIAAVAELGLPVDVVAVVPAVENMPSGTAMRPGDIITQLNGKTVEVNNTDAEGRLILADALTWCARQGADRIVDVATLTGAVVVALGSTYAAIIANDDDWAEEVTRAGEVTGELLWRLPLHPEYKQLTKGTAADLTNAAAKRKAGTIYAGSFLEEFVEGTTWAHLDIAGTSWDVGREYVGNGATGFGVRLLVELIARMSSRSAEPGPDGS